MSYRDLTEREIIGALLMGGSTLFGKRVELAWPDGLPLGMTADGLRDFGATMAPAADPPQWIPADTRTCEAAITCGRILKDGKCGRHGEPS